MKRSLPIAVPDVRSLLRQVVRYAASGGFGLGINVALLVGLVEVVGLSATVAPLLSTAVALTVTLAITDRWVFRRYRWHDLRTAAIRTPAYYFVMIGGKLVNYGIYLGLTSVDVPYPVAWIIGSGIVFVGTFSANRFIWLR